VARPFEDGLELMGIQWDYYGDDFVLPKNYQFYTRASESRFMTNWRAKFTLESGLNKYLSYLNQNR
jgi:hypothetical protein